MGFLRRRVVTALLTVNAINPLGGYTGPQGSVFGWPTRNILGFGLGWPTDELAPQLLALVGVDRWARVLNEEIFGPVAPVITFEDEKEAVQLANSTQYGLVAYVYTRDLARSLRMTESLEAGMLGVNTGMVSNPAAPFGGVKQSGLSREGGIEGIEEYLETAYVAIADPGDARG